jgi:hypothetical protein
VIRRSIVQCGMFRFHDGSRVRQKALQVQRCQGVENPIPSPRYVPFWVPATSVTLAALFDRPSHGPSEVRRLDFSAIVSGEIRRGDSQEFLCNL